MTFQAFEKSPESGRPVELYEFRVGPTPYRFTSGDVDVTFEDDLWRAVPIKRSEFSAATGEQSDGEAVVVILPADEALAALFVLAAPDAGTTVAIRRYHPNDPDLEAVTVFRGLVRAVSFEGDGHVAQLKCTALTAAFSRTIPRHTYQSLCNHHLYDARCRINEHDPTWEKFLPISASSADTVTATGASAFGASFFEAGFAQFAQDFRLITKQAGDVLTLLAPFAVSPVGQTIRLLAGCKLRIAEDCRDKFSNAINFGGFPFVPQKNPFAVGLD